MQPLASRWASGGSRSLSCPSAAEWLERQFSWIANANSRPKADRQTFSRFDGYAAIEAIQDGEAWDLSSGLPIPAALLQSVESEPVGRPAPNILMA